jgi:hypothetical protein
MDAWKASTTTGDLNEVPGIGEKTIEKLANADDPADSITNTFQLFGKFLMLKGPGHSGSNCVTPMEHTDKFWVWLQNRGISSHRSAIVRAVSFSSSLVVYLKESLSSYTWSDVFSFLLRIQTDRRKIGHLFPGYL